MRTVSLPDLLVGSKLKSEIFFFLKEQLASLTDLGLAHRLGLRKAYTKRLTFRVRRRGCVHSMVVVVVVVRRMTEGGVQHCLK